MVSARSFVYIFMMEIGVADTQTNDVAEQKQPFSIIILSAAPCREVQSHVLSLDDCRRSALKSPMSNLTS